MKLSCATFIATGGKCIDLNFYSHSILFISEVHENRYRPKSYYKRMYIIMIISSSQLTDI